MDEDEWQRAKRSPWAVFETPEAIRDHAGLTLAQRIELLRIWAYDARELLVAEEEGMAGGERVELARVARALSELTGGSDPEHRPPTKQGGI